jgi:hypothetical protein
MVARRTNQDAEFDRFGILRIAGAIAKRDVDGIRDRVWDTLSSRYQIRRDAPQDWKPLRAATANDLPKSLRFDQIGSPIVCGVLDDLMGRGNWQRHERWSQLLVAFPESTERWDVPHQNWHLDLPASQALERLFAVRLFACLAAVQPGGGGTVAVAGSHRLVENLIRKTGSGRIRSADVRRLLIRAYPWMKALCTRNENTDRVQRFMKRSVTLDGVEARVVEMTGEAGDVILMHPLIMHAPAKNCSADPRLVLAATVCRRGVALSALYQ